MNQKQQSTSPTDRHISSRGASSSMMQDRMFPDAYEKNKQTLVDLTGPSPFVQAVFEHKTHPLHDVLDALLVLATCQQLNDGYSGVGYGFGGGTSTYGQYITEGVAFALGFRFGGSGDGVKPEDFGVPLRYFDLVQVVRSLRASWTIEKQKEDPEHKEFLRLSQKFGSAK